MSSSRPISSATITLGLIDLISIFIPIDLGILSSTSVRNPTSFCGIPLYIAAISLLSSASPTFTPLNPISGIPLLIFLTKSLSIVVFPLPGGDTIIELNTVFLSKFIMYSKVL